MDPRTGRPIEGLLSATIITPSGVEAEALSKALMVMGIDKSREFLKNRPQVRAILYYNQPEGGVGSARLNF
jgi:thiamine biosynthesis lipoprotein